MKIHVYLLCYNEDEIIRQVLSHYSTFCSRIFLLDNYSTDNSVHIATEFDNVRVLQWSSSNQFDDCLAVQIKESYYKQYSRTDGSFCSEVADWVIVCDMDELIYHPRLSEVLADYRAQRVTVANVVGFNMVSPLEPQKLPQLFPAVRMGKPAPVFNKPVLFDPEFDMVFSPGAHPHGVGYQQMQQQFGYKMGKQQVALLHYKYIGLRYLRRAKLARERLSEVNLNLGYGVHYLDSDNDLDSRYLKLHSEARLVIDDDGEIIF